VDFFAGIDGVRRGKGGNLNATLRSMDPIAHEYAEPLFSAGVHDIFLTQRIDYHTGPDAARKAVNHNILILLQGRLSATLGRGRKVLEPGMICVVPAQVARRFATLDGSATWIYFDMRPVPLWHPLEARGAGIREYEFANSMRSLVVRVLKAYQSDSVADKHVAIALSGGILELLKYELSAIEHRPSVRAAEVEALFKRIQANPEENWTLKRMVAETNLPVRSLTRHCNRIYGSPPLELVIRQRLRVACWLLGRGEDTSLDEIAVRVGYSCGSSLSTVFTRHMGIRPAKYRRDVRGKPRTEEEKARRRALRRKKDAEA
jgi:AraC-like DNA-binding protein